MAEGFLPASVRVMPGRDDVVLRLERPWTMTGRVVRPDGSPVAGARVRAEPVAWESETPTCQAISTIDGTFEIPGLRDVAYHVSATLGTEGAIDFPHLSHDGDREHRKEDGPVEVVLEPFTGIAVRLSLAGGGSRHEYRVLVEASGGDASYVFDSGRPRSFMGQLVGVEPDQPYDITVKVFGHPEERVIRNVVAARGTIETVDVDLDPGVLVDGVVRSQREWSRPGEVSVRFVRQGGGGEVTATADARGRFLAGYVAPGLYDVTASRSEMAGSTTFVREQRVHPRVIEVSGDTQSVVLTVE